MTYAMRRATGFYRLFQAIKCNHRGPTYTPRDQLSRGTSHGNHHGIPHVVYHGRRHESARGSIFHGICHGTGHGMHHWLSQTMGNYMGCSQRGKCYTPKRRLTNIIWADGFCNIFAWSVASSLVCCAWFDSNSPMQVVVCHHVSWYVELSLGGRSAPSFPLRLAGR